MFYKTHFFKSCYSNNFRDYNKHNQSVWSSSLKHIFFLKTFQPAVLLNDPAPGSRPGTSLLVTVSLQWNLCYQSCHPTPSWPALPTHPWTHETDHDDDYDEDDTDLTNEARDDLTKTYMNILPPTASKWQDWSCCGRLCSTRRGWCLLNCDQFSQILLCRAVGAEIMKS